MSPSTLAPQGAALSRGEPVVRGARIAPVASMDLQMRGASEEGSIGATSAFIPELALEGGRAFDLAERPGIGWAEDAGDDVIGELTAGSLEREFALADGTLHHEDAADAAEAADVVDAVDEGPPVVISLRGGSSGSMSSGGSVSGAAAQVASRSIEDAYEHGHALLKEGRSADAAAVFDELLARGGRHDLMDNAMYWSGYARAQQGDHRRAIATWQRLPLRFPRSAKVPDALYGMAVAHEVLGEPAVAETLYGQLLAQHPRAEKAGESRKALMRLKPR